MLRVAVSKVRMPRSQRIMFSLPFRAEVERVARRGLEGAYAALAEDYVLVAVRHDVLGAHQQLLDCVRKAAFDEYGLARLAELFQQLEVLHIARADLNHVDFLEEGQMVRVHNFRDYRKPSLFFGFEQKVDAVGLEPLEVVGRRARLEGSASEHRRAGGLDALRHGDDLLLALDRARAGDYSEVAVSYWNLRLAYLYHGVKWMEFSVRVLEGLGDVFHAFDDVEAREQFVVKPADIADYADYRRVISFGEVRAQPLSLYPAHKVVDAFFFRVRFYYDYHLCIPPEKFPRLRRPIKKACGEVVHSPQALISLDFVCFEKSVSQQKTPSLI